MFYINFSRRPAESNGAKNESFESVYGCRNYNNDPNSRPRNNAPLDTTD